MNQEEIFELVLGDVATWPEVKSVERTRETQGREAGAIITFHPVVAHTRTRHAHTDVLRWGITSECRFFVPVSCRPILVEAYGCHPHLRYAPTDELRMHVMCHGNAQFMRDPFVFFGTLREWYVGITNSLMNHSWASQAVEWWKNQSDDTLVIMGPRKARPQIGKSKVMPVTKEVRTAFIASGSGIPGKCPLVERNNGRVQVT